VTSSFQRATLRARRNAEREESMRLVILSIPRGKVSTYAKVAAAAGYPGYHRQVVQLLNREGDALPWQRVVGAGGVIRTRGEHNDTQRGILEAEGVRFQGDKIDMHACEHDLRPWDIPDR
jgi:methylated-DNA-protein-cysteine methyltransferase related protein